MSKRLDRLLEWAENRPPQVRQASAERPAWSKPRMDPGTDLPLNDLERIVWLLNRVIDDLEGNDGVIQ